jgi:hypothetical protein
MARALVSCIPDAEWQNGATHTTLTPMLVEGLLRCHQIHFDMQDLARNVRPLAPALSGWSARLTYTRQGV